MKILFLKDTTVDVMVPEDGTNDTFDRLVRKGTIVESNEIVSVLNGYSSIWTDHECLVSVKNDCFKVVKE